MLAERLVQVFDFQAAALYERDRSDVSCVGIASPEGIQNILQNAAVLGGSSPQEEPPYMIVTVSRGSEPVASMALRGVTMPGSVLQGVANLVAIDLERARAQDLAQQVEAARQSEQARTTLIDAMAHKFKTPLTLIRAATTSLLANPEIAIPNRTEQLAIANEEAEHMQELIDDAIEMARLDTAHIEIHPELASLEETLREVRASMQTEIDERPVQIAINGALPAGTLR
jgi:two-component system sensor histidine kinase KdpD